MTNDGQEIDTEAGPQKARRGYDFHDEAFVTWWLGSLYLLSADDQVAVAQRLASVIHAPEARAEIEAFIEFRSEATLEAPVDGDGSAAVSDSRMDQVRFRLIELWQANPWMVGIGCIAIAILAGKGAWFAAKEFFRLVF